MIKICRTCSSTLKNRYSVYCSNKCQGDFEYKIYIEKWKNGDARGDRGISAKNISGHVRRYLLETSSGACSSCGWNEINPVTGKVPLEIDHIDGNSENNTERNLRVICPNCHALTASYRNLNKGNGRTWRKLKYIKNT